MTGKLKALTALAVEDIRQEADGALSLMGLFPDGLFEFDELPERRRFGIILVFDVVEVGQVALQASLQYNDDIKWRAELVLQLDEVGSGLLVPIGMTNALFDEPGRIELLLSCDEGEADLVKSWPIRLADDLEALSPNLPA